MQMTEAKELSWGVEKHPGTERWRCVRSDGVTCGKKHSSPESASRHIILAAADAPSITAGMGLGSAR